ncbi:Uncharacterised protein [Vibrio cholerae]|nr:Uncharacterised protein [Vibrio cholerae]
MVLVSRDQAKFFGDFVLCRDFDTGKFRVCFVIFITRGVSGPEVEVTHGVTQTRNDLIR